MNEIRTNYNVNPEPESVPQTKNPNRVLPVAPVVQEVQHLRSHEELAQASIKTLEDAKSKANEDANSAILDNLASRRLLQAELEGYRAKLQELCSELETVKASESQTRKDKFRFKATTSDVDNFSLRREELTLDMYSLQEMILDLQKTIEPVNYYTVLVRNYYPKILAFDPSDADRKHLGNLLNELKEAFRKEHQFKIEDLQNKISTLNTDITPLEIKLKALRDEVNAVTSELSPLSSERDKHLNFIASTSRDIENTCTDAMNRVALVIDSELRNNTRVHVQPEAPIVQVQEPVQAFSKIEQNRLIDMYLKGK